LGVYVNVLGINAVFHDSAAALLVDGRIVAASEEERFSRRKHGKTPVPFSTWELPIQAATWCLEDAGLTPADLDAVAYSYDPSLAPRPGLDVTLDKWEGLRTLYAQRAPLFLKAALPGLDPERVRFVPHHLAHAASAAFASGWERCAFLTVDGRGERHTHLSGRRAGSSLEVLASTSLPDSLGLLYEGLTEHLGFLRSSDEYKVMALAAYGVPTAVGDLRDLVTLRADGSVWVAPFDWEWFAPRVPRLEAAEMDEAEWVGTHADLAASVQLRVEELLLEMAEWLHRRTGERRLAMAGGVALNCVANARLLAEGPFDEVWVQPAAGDSGTALGAAYVVAAQGGDEIAPFKTAALGREFSEREIELALSAAGIPYERPDDVAEATADVLARNGVVAWYQGRSEWGPRALGHRSLLADPRPANNLARLNEIKGREQFRPVAPMVTAEKASAIFSGRLPSEYMLFTHEVAPEWRPYIPTVCHVDGTARVQTVDRAEEPLVHRMLSAFEERTAVPVVVNTSLNTAGRPIVDTPADVLECFGSSPIDAAAIGPFFVRRASLFGGADSEQSQRTERDR
jgi:carbamoyltransferase